MASPQSQSPNSPPSGSSMSSPSTNAMIPSVLCKGRHLEADVLTSMTNSHPGRRFYRRPLRQHDDCGFFRWIDPDIPPYQKGCFVRVKIERDSLREQLRCKNEMEKILTEKLKIKEAEVENLQVEMEKKIEYHEVKRKLLIQDKKDLKYKLSVMKSVAVGLLIVVVVLLFVVVLGGRRGLLKEKLMLN